MTRGVRGIVGGRVVFGEYPRTVVAAQDEHGLHREEGHSGGHGVGVPSRRRGLSVGVSRAMAGVVCFDVERSPDSSPSLDSMDATVWFSGASTWWVFFGVSINPLRWPATHGPHSRVPLNASLDACPLIGFSARRAPHNPSHLSPVSSQGYPVAPQHFSYTTLIPQIPSFQSLEHTLRFRLTTRHGYT